MMVQHSLYQTVLDYAERGWRVFPTNEQKKPCNEHGCTDGTRDTTQLQVWWRRWPGANIGIATGIETGLVVIDIDPDKGGLDSLPLLQEQYGDLPHTLTVKTGGGGWHYYFSHPGGRLPNKSPIKGFPGIDVRGDGGYVLAPPSVSVKGAYTWDIDAPIAALPLSYVELLTERPRATHRSDGSALSHDDAGDYWLERYLSDAQQGSRNVNGFLLACQLRDSGLSESEATPVMYTYASRCDSGDEPYTDREALASLKSAYRRMKREPAKSQTSTPYAPESSQGQPPVAPQGSYKRTDMGNAERLRDRHGTNIRYCYIWKSWMAWTGKQWERDEGNHIMTLAKETARSILVESAGLEGDEQKEHIKWAMKSQSKKGLEYMIALTQDLCPATPHEFDRDLMLWNSPNGTTDLRTGELHPHRREDMITKMSPVDRIPGSTCSLFQSNLRRFMAEDEEMIAYLQRWAGYALTGDVSERAMEIAYGKGSNWKSTFIDTLQEIWGEYARAIATETLMATKYDRSGPEIAQLPGVRLAVASEGEDAQYLAVARMKRMTGGAQEKLTAEAKYEKPFEFTPTHKVFFMTNKRPMIRDTTNGTWNRVHLQPWNVTIPSEEIDTSFPERLKAEYSGILEWAIQGCLLWRQHGLRPPKAIQEATRAYRDEMNTVEQFIDDLCVTGKNYEAKSAELYAAFKGWCEAHGERAPRINDFAERMQENGWEKKATMHGKVWLGLRLRGDQETLFDADDTHMTADDGSSQQFTNARVCGERTGSAVISRHSSENGHAVTTLPPRYAFAADVLPQTTTTCQDCGQSAWKFSAVHPKDIICTACHPKERTR